MKKMILLALFAVPAAVLAQDSNFIIKAKVGSDIAPAKAYLIYRAGAKVFTDSAMVDNGAFQFKGTVAEPIKAQLILDHKGIGLSRLGQDADVVLLYLEKGNINITGQDSVKNALISGAKINDENKSYNALIAAPEKAMAMLNSQYQAASESQRNDQAFMDGLQARYDKAKEEKRLLQYQYIKQNPDAYRSLLTLIELGEPDMDVVTIEPLFNGLSVAIRTSPTGLEFTKLIAAARAVAIGATAPLFTQNDVNDQPVSLSSFRGKYVLLDFWASWCGPCRGENPNVVKAYDQYKNKNFTVLSVSLDRPGKKEDWLAAIKADGLEWTQVSDLKFWDNEVAKQYGIRAIPQNFLIDPSGKIIAKNLRGDELNKKLATLFN
jgi:peroxiredoxin